MRAPNYNFERQERDKAKAAKKAEKAELKASKRESETRTKEGADERPEPQSDAAD